VVDGRSRRAMFYWWITLWNIKVKDRRGWVVVCNYGDVWRFVASFSKAVYGRYEARQSTPWKVLWVIPVTVCERNDRTEYRRRRDEVVTKASQTSPRASNEQKECDDND
jgi:hypothetical protein